MSYFLICAALLGALAFGGVGKRLPWDKSPADPNWADVTVKRGHPDP